MQTNLKLHDVVFCLNSTSNYISAYRSILQKKCLSSCLVSKLLKKQVISTSSPNYIRYNHCAYRLIHTGFTKKHHVCQETVQMKMYNTYCISYKSLHYYFIYDNKQFYKYTMINYRRTPIIRTNWDQGWLG